MRLKQRAAKFAHPALLIIVLGLVYAFTIGGYPHDAGPIDGADVDAAVVAHVVEEQSEPVVSSVVSAAVEQESTDVLPAVTVALQNVESVPQGVEPPRPQAEKPPQQKLQPVPIESVANVGGPNPEDIQPLDQRPRLQVFSHTVQLGETLTEIAKAYNVDVDTIIAANNIADPNRIRSGDVLAVPNVKGVLHEVKKGESLWNIANLYEVSMDEIIEANELSNPNSLQVGQKLLIPGAQALVSARQREALVSANGQLLRNFSWPTTGRISSRFGPRWGRMHYGLDIAVPTGTPVRAAAAGKVTFAGEQGGYGLLVKIDHGNNIETRYAHNSRIVVRAGQQVARGDIIAYSGNTGNSTGPHVHFEIRRNGIALDPLDFLR